MESSENYNLSPSPVVLRTGENLARDSGVDDICLLRSIKRNGKRICGRAFRQVIMRVSKLTRCNVMWRCGTIEDVGRRQGVTRVNMVRYNEIGTGMLDAEGPDNGAF